VTVAANAEQAAWPSTTDGQARLTLLDRFGILDTPAEQGFDDIVLLACRSCETPVALVSLVAEDRQWFKARIGFPACETPLSQSICAHALKQSETLIIPDLALDARTRNNALVKGEPFIRFYAGALLRTPEDIPIGTLCVIDTAPRPRGLTETQKTSLEALARQVMTQMELRRVLAQNADAMQRRQAAEAADRQLRDEAERQRTALLELGNRLDDKTDAGEMASTAAEIMGLTLDASAAGYATVSADGETVLVERDWTAPGFASYAGQHSMHAYGLQVDDLRAGRAVVVDGIGTTASAQVLQSVPASVHYPRSVRHAEALDAGFPAQGSDDGTCHAPSSAGPRALINVPLIEHGRLVAIFFVVDTKPRQWTAETLSFVRNVAERTRAAIERQHAEGRLRDLASSLEKQVAERTADRNRLWQLSTDIMLVARFDGTVIAVNPAWTTLLGWPKAELVGRNLFELIHPADLDASTSSIRSVSEGTTPWQFRNRYRHRDGSYRWLSWTAVPGEGLINAVGRDFTAEQEQAEALAQAEDQLRQSQKMEAVGQLTGGLAHDFNNLLVSISGSLELMQTRVAQGRIKDLDRYIHAAQGGAKRAAALTHRLLAFSRQQTLDPKPTNVNRLVSGMEELIRRTVGPEIAVEVAGAAGLWNTLIDPSQLENALLNLSINARDAMPRGGKLTIETGNRWLDERAARERELPCGQYVSLCVSDNGTGMAPDVIARAFDPFFTTKPIGHGTGLGLSMIYGFARQSGGQVRIYSEPGQGAMVCLYLPRHQGNADQADVPAELSDAPRAGYGETVLVVDDEPAVRMLVTEVLEDRGYTAIEAADGSAGLRVLQSNARMDLLVTDVGLPGGMNGRQVAEAARLARPGLKVLFITGYAENAVLSHGHLDSGMQVLTKPFAMEALANRIKDMISGK